MSAQEESTHIVHPFSVYLRHKGWHVEKTHGSQFQSGFPDLFIMHAQYGSRWVECKVLRDNNFHFEESQKNKFPIWIAHGVKIWIVYGTDMRGVNGIPQMEKMYLSLFKEANAPYMLNPELRRMLLKVA